MLGLSWVQRRKPTEVQLQSACYAPHSALYFRPDGQVSACCATGYEAGIVTGPLRNSLEQIWNGARLAAQRKELERGSYAFACQECELAESTGGRSAALASHFDRWATGAPHDFPKLLDFALSNRCNLQCVMCNGELSSSIRKDREGLPPLPLAYDDRFFEELKAFLPHAERLQFKGGEPFLAPENHRIWDFLIENGLEPEVSVTTNGTVFSDKVAQYVTALRMHPNISVDAMDHAKLESIRVGVNATTFWRNVDRFQELAETAGNGMTMSFCLMAQNWQELLPFAMECDRREVNCNVIFVNQPKKFDLFRLPLDELSGIERSLTTLSAELSTQSAKDAWQGALERIRSQIESPVELKIAEVSDRPHLQLRGASTSEIGSLVENLKKTYGVDPLAVSLTDGTVTEVSEPPWAQWLGATSWMGLAEQEIAHSINSQADTTISTLGRDRSDPLVEQVQISIEVGERVEPMMVSIAVGRNRRKSWVFVSPKSSQKSNDQPT